MYALTYVLGWRVSSFFRYGIKQLAHIISLAKHQYLATQHQKQIASHVTAGTGTEDETSFLAIFEVKAC